MEIIIFVVIGIGVLLDLIIAFMKVDSLYIESTPKRQKKRRSRSARRVTTKKRGFVVNHPWEARFFK